jgi:hypothetical protein
MFWIFAKPVLQMGVGISTGCGAYHEARWLGESRYGAEVYKVSEVSGEFEGDERVGGRSRHYS